MTNRTVNTVSTMIATTNTPKTMSKANEKVVASTSSG